MDDERVPKPSRSESEERRRLCADARLRDLVPQSSRSGRRGQGPERDRGRIRVATPADKLQVFSNRWELVFGSSASANFREANSAKFIHRTSANRVSAKFILSCYEGLAFSPSSLRPVPLRFLSQPLLTQSSYCIPSGMVALSRDSAWSNCS
jgi:hypothetical protein